MKTRSCTSCRSKDTYSRCMPPRWYDEWKCLDCGHTWFVETPAERADRNLLGGTPTRALAMRYLHAASAFYLPNGGIAIKRWREGWAVMKGSRVYRADGLMWWTRSVAARWHYEECEIENLGKAFTLAEQIGDKS